MDGDRMDRAVPRPSLRLFGGFRLAQADGRPIAVSLRKAEALLAYLAVTAGQTAPRELLATLLWGEYEQHRARQSLRQVLLALTKVLGQCDGPILRIDGQDVSLVPDSLVVDVAGFEHLMIDGAPEALAKAAALHKGEFLAGLRLDAPNFEDWLGATQSRLNDMALNGLLALLGHQETAEDIGPAVATANQALRIDPFREDIHRRLMRLYMGRGLRSSALTQYRLCRDILDRDLGVAPDRETAELHEGILRGRLEGADRTRRGTAFHAGEPVPADRHLDQGAARATTATRPPERCHDEARPLRTQLPDTARRLLDAACVAGLRSGCDLVARAAGLDESETAGALEMLVGGKVLSIDGETLVFPCATTHRAFYDELVPPRRKLIHAELARTIEELHAGALALHYQALAHHRQNAGQVREALQAAYHAAMVAKKRGDPKAARRILLEAQSAAARVPDNGTPGALDIDIPLALGCLAEDEGDVEDAAAYLRTAKSLAERAADERRMAEVLVAQSRILYGSGDHAAAVRSLRRALTESDGSSGATAWLPIEAFLARPHVVSGGSDTVVCRLERRMRRERALGLGVEEASTAALLALVTASRGDFERALAECETAVALAEAAGCAAGVALGLEARGVVQLWRGDHRAALDGFERALAIAESRGDLPRLYVLGGFRAAALVASGRGVDGRAALCRTIALAERINTRFLVPLFKALLAEVLAGEGSDAEALATGREAYRLAANGNQPWAGSIASRAFARASMRRETRDLGRAERAIRASIATQDGLGLKFEQARSLVLHAAIQRARGKTSESRQTFSKARALARRLGMVAGSGRPANTA